MRASTLSIGVVSAVYFLTFAIAASQDPPQTFTVTVKGADVQEVQSPSATVSGGPRTGFDTSRNLWVVVDSGTLARVLPTPVHLCSVLTSAGGETGAFSDGRPW